MASPDIKELRPGISLQDIEEMSKYGITNVPVDYFHYRDHRYTNLKDAVAQAKREQRPGRAPSWVGRRQQSGTFHGA